MKRLVRLINNYFIKIVLFVFYFVVIGLGSLIYHLSKKNYQKDSYWENPPKKPLDIEYFQSSY